MPSAPSPDPARPSGWGLYLVAELADRWGVDSDEAHAGLVRARPPAAARSDGLAHAEQHLDEELVEPLVVVAALGERVERLGPRP